MWQNGYFITQYQSPNIIIVPAKSFPAPPRPPETQQIPISITSSPRFCEQITCVEDNNIGEPLPFSSNCNQQNSQIVNTSFNTSTSTAEFSERNYFENSPFIIQDTTSTEALSYNRSPSEKELCSSKYKSHNNLVDLTGINLLEKDKDGTSSLIIRQDLRQVGDSKIKKDEVKMCNDEIEYQDYLDSDTYKTVIAKEYSTNLKPKSNHSKSTEFHTNIDSKENMTDMENKVNTQLRLFRHHYIDKLKHKTAQEIDVRARKSQEIKRDESKDLKSESSRHKPNLQKDSKNNSTNDLRNKIIENSKRYRDLDRDFIAKYPKRSKSETRSRHLPDLKESLRDGKLELRRKEDNKNKYNTGNRRITENLSHKKIRMKSPEKTTNEPDIRMKVDLRKQSIKTEKHNIKDKIKNYTNRENATGPSYKDKVTSIKSIVRVDNNQSNNISQIKCVDEVEDLRSRLSRKRTRCDDPKDNKLDRERSVKNIKQAVSMNASTLPTENKATTKKFKKIKLIINIECVNSDSDDSGQDSEKRCSSPEDVSFLDDFDVDEIVETLNSCQNSQIERHKIITINNTQSKVVSNINKHDNKETKPKCFSKNLEAIQINKEETCLQKDPVMDINSVKKINGDVSKSNEAKPKNDLINNANMKAIEITNKGEYIFPKRQLIKINYINNINNNDCKNNEETKSTNDIKNDNIKAIEIKKEKTSFDKKQVIDINSINKLDETDSKNKEVVPTEGIVSDVKMKDVQKKHVNEINESDSKTNKETKSTEGPMRPSAESLISNVNWKTIKSNKDEISLYRRQIIEICSDTDDKNVHLKNGSVANTSTCKEEQKMKSNSKIETNSHKQDTNNTKNLIRKAHEESAPIEIIDISMDEQNVHITSKIEINSEQQSNNITISTGKVKETCATKKTVDLSDASSNSIVEVINITDENEDYTISKRECLVNKVILAKSYIQCSDVNKKTLKTSLSKTTNEPLSKHKCNTPLMKTAFEKTVNQKLKQSNILDKKQTQLQKLDNSIPYQTLLNIVKNKSYNTTVKSDEIQQLNTLDKYVKERNDNTLNSKNTGEVSVDSIFYNLVQNSSIRKNIESNSIRCDKDNINKDIEISLSGQQLKNEKDLLQTAPQTIEAPVELISNIVDKNENLNKTKIVQPIKTDQHIKTKSVNQTLPQATKNNIVTNVAIQMNAKQSNSKENHSQSSGSIALKTEENIVDKKANYHLRTFEDKGNQLTDKTTNNIEKKINNVVKVEKPTVKLLLENSEVITKKSLVSSNIQNKDNFPNSEKSNKLIDKTTNNIEKNTNNLVTEEKPTVKLLLENSEVITEKSLVSSNIQHKDSFANSAKLNKLIDITTNNIEKKTSNVVTEEKPIVKLPLENSAVITEKSLVNSNIQHKAKFPIRVESKKLDKNIEEILDKISIVKEKKSLMAKEFNPASTKSNVGKQAKSLKTAVKITQKLETNKTISNTKQEQIAFQKTNETKYKDETKSNKPEIFSPTIDALLSSTLEWQMTEYFQKKYIVSIIRHGHYSTIYKCHDNRTQNKAVKVFRQRQKGMFVEGILLLLQQYTSRQESSVIYLFQSFEVDNRWCLLTEYYPMNLDQALMQNRISFHIDQVQVLSRQLVNAVCMVTNAGVIHSEIKPAHILLNNTQNRLKLCGFERAFYSTCSNIIPSTGTPRYRAPEIILGFQEDHRIDVWSTALVMFEMATNKPLFTGFYNNEILHQQLCTFKSFDWSMAEQSRYKNKYFLGKSFKLQTGHKVNTKNILVNSFNKNDNLRRILFDSYSQYWAQVRTSWQITKDLDKLETFARLMEQMLTLDPRLRLPIQFVDASEFMNHTFTIS